MHELANMHCVVNNDVNNPTQRSLTLLYKDTARDASSVMQTQQQTYFSLSRWKEEFNMNE